MKLNSKNIRVNSRDEIWLYQHGGRFAEDVFQDREGKYVFMGDGRGGEHKVYMPNSSDLEIVDLRGYHKHNGVLY